MTRKTHALSGLAVELADGPVEVTQGVDPWGQPYRILHLGDALAVHVSLASPEVLRQLADSAAELADWRQQQIAEPLPKAVA